MHRWRTCPLECRTSLYGASKGSRRPGAKASNNWPGIQGWTREYWRRLGGWWARVFRSLLAPDTYLERFERVDDHRLEQYRSNQKDNANVKDQSGGDAREAQIF